MTSKQYYHPHRDANGTTARDGVMLGNLSLILKMTSEPECNWQLPETWEMKFEINNIIISFISTPYIMNESNSDAVTLSSLLPNIFIQQQLNAPFYELRYTASVFSRMTATNHIKTGTLKNIGKNIILIKFRFIFGCLNPTVTAIP
jgi:hypothetical protein